MAISESVLSLIRTHAEGASNSTQTINEASRLAELGLDSLRLVTLLLTLHDEYSVDLMKAMDRGMPDTVGELIGLMQVALDDSGRPNI